MAIQDGTSGFLLALLATFAAAIPAVLLFMWIRVKGAASNGQQLGRKWLAWMVASLTLTVGARFFAHNFDLNFLAQWAIGVVVLGGLAYGLGWAYWKLVREKPWKRIVSSTMAEPDKDRLYEIAWKEIELKRIDKALWAKAYAESDGDREKTKARYLKSRVRQLQERTGSTLERGADEDRPVEESKRLALLDFLSTSDIVPVIVAIIIIALFFAAL